MKLGYKLEGNTAELVENIFMYKSCIIGARTVTLTGSVAKDVFNDFTKSTKLPFEF